jgi:ankyrin repeat protein
MQEAKSLQLIRGNESCFIILTTNNYFQEEQMVALLDEAQETGCQELELLLLSRKGTIETFNTDGNLPIHRACIINNRKLVENILEQGVDVNAKNYDDQSPIHLASQRHEQELVEILITHGADANLMDGEGQNALHTMFKNNYDDMKGICAILLKAGADPNVQRDSDKSTPCHLAAAFRRSECIRLLIEYGSNLSIYNNLGKNPLHMAVQAGSAETVQILVDLGGGSSAANIESLDKFRPLHFAAMGYEASVCDVLLTAGAELEATDPIGRTALHIAASQSTPAVVTLLLSAGAQVNTTADDGSSPLHVAAGNEPLEILSVLIQSGANISSRDRQGFTPFLSAAFAGQASAIEALSLHHSDINATTCTGATALHLAAKSNHHRAIRVLLALRVNVNDIDDNGATALDIAELSKSKAATILLKRSGAKTGKELGICVAPCFCGVHLAAIRGDVTEIQAMIDKERSINLREASTGNTPLHYAALLDKTEALKFLSENGADVFAQSSYGETTLHFAVKAKSLHAVSYLLEKGLNPHTADFSGTRPLHLACSLGAEEIVYKFLSLLTATDTRVLHSVSTIHGTPLSAAAIEGNVNIVQALITAGTPLDVVHSWYGPPLFAACAHGRKDVVKLLLEKGAKTTADGVKFKTAEEVAEACKRDDVLEILRAYKAEVAAKEAEMELRGR